MNNSKILAAALLLLASGQTANAAQQSIPRNVEIAAQPTVAMQLQEQRSLLANYKPNSLITVSALLENDQKAHAYCLSQKNTFIAVVMPDTYSMGHGQKVEQLLNRYGIIKYKKEVVLSPAQACHLLTMAHPQWSMQEHFQKHFSWYFPSDSLKNPARIYVVRFFNLPTAVTCKDDIRELFDINFRSIHMNDTQREAIELAKFFFLESDKHNNKSNPASAQRGCCNFIKNMFCLNPRK